jgi:hypothetical protein
VLGFILGFSNLAFADVTTDLNNPINYYSNVNYGCTIGDKLFWYDDSYTNANTQSCSESAISAYGLGIAVGTFHIIECDDTVIGSLCGGVLSSYSDARYDAGYISETVIKYYIPNDPLDTTNYMYQLLFISSTFIFSSFITYYIMKRTL